MARRRRAGPVEDLMSVVSKLPWWLGLTLSALSYILLSNYVAKSASVIDANTGISAAFVQMTMLHTLASVGQYLLPVLLLIGAIASLANRAKRDSLFHSAVNSESDSSLRNINWREFEILVGELFRRCGYTISETGGSGADGGVDLKLRKGSEIFLVQCKQWRAYKVSVNVVRELYGVMAAEGAAGGFVVTSGVFTSDAKAFASDKSIELIDGLQLSALLRETHVGHTGGVWRAEAAADIAESGTLALSPLCPRCGAAMVKRTARRGQNAGREFWGCTGYPRCRGIVDV